MIKKTKTQIQNLKKHKNTKNHKTHAKTKTQNKKQTKQVPIPKPNPYIILCTQPGCYNLKLFQTKVVEKTKTYFMLDNLFSKIVPFIR